MRFDNAIAFEPERDPPAGDPFLTLPDQCAGLSSRAEEYKARLTRMSQFDRFRSVSFLHSHRSGKPNFCETKFYEAAVGDLTLPALTRRSRFRFKFNSKDVL